MGVLHYLIHYFWYLVLFFFAYALYYMYNDNVSKWPLNALRKETEILKI